MDNMRSFSTVVATAFALVCAGCAARYDDGSRMPEENLPLASRSASMEGARGYGEKVVKTEKEWREMLTPEQYEVTREKGTERAFTGKYHATKDKGEYRCVCCGNLLFSSEAKFDSGTGWPSFSAAAVDGNVGEEQDVRFGTKRTEVLCTRCGAHLGHVFEDGPKPSGLRYCVNSASLDLVKEP
jgi:peptide-methionine (R)-S-oxide reductase